MAEYTNLPAGIAAEQQFRFNAENLQQEMQRSQLNQLDIARQKLLLEETQKDSPLKDLNRQVQIGTQKGVLERQPFEQSVLTDEAKFKASPNFREVVKDVELKQEQEKARAVTLKRNADQMDQFAQAIGPVIERLKAGDVTGANDAWSAAGDTLESYGVNKKELQKIPMSLLQQRYQQAIQTAPVLRKQYEAIETASRQREHDILAHQNKLKEIEAQEKARRSAIRDEFPKSEAAVLGRILEQYRKDSKSLNEAEKGILREELTTRFERYNQRDAQDLQDKSEAMIAQDEQKNNNGKKYEDRGLRMRQKYRELLNMQLRQTHPDLFTSRVTSPNTKDDIYKRFNLTPPKTSDVVGR